MCDDVESGLWSYGLALLGSNVNPKALTFDQSGGDEAGGDPPSDEEAQSTIEHVRCSYVGFFDGSTCR